MFDPRRRKRRRYVIPLLVTLAALVVVVASSFGRDTRATIAHLEEVRSSAVEVSRAGSNLEGLVRGLSRIDRAEFVAVTDGVLDALADARRVAEADPPAKELTGAMTLYRLALDAWSQGITGVAEAVLAAADDPTDATVVDDLSSAVVLVRAGDRIYSALLEELAREDVPSPVTAMPEIRLLPVDVSVHVLAEAWVSAARAGSSGLALRPSIRIEQVSVQPEWVKRSDGSIVVPATETIDVIVVVSNGGNTDTAVAVLALTLAPSDGEAEMREAEVGVLAPGASTSVVFRELSVVPGTFYHLDLLLDPAGPDAFPDDNVHSTGFLINEATTTDD